jgi:outer membrane protein OmpU
MNNFKKIGLTALAGSLVATSVAYAAELTASGSASIAIENNSQKATGKTVSMGNSVNFAGSGETDGGLTISLAFELDQGAADGTTTRTNSTGVESVSDANGTFDSHSVSVAHESLGTVTVHGHGGSNAASALDTTAAGDLWDNGFGISTNDTPKAAASGNGLIVYKLPTVIDDVAVSASYSTAGEDDASSTAWGLTYTGFEGLTVNYGQGNDNSTASVDIDQTIMKASYAIGSFTVGFSDNDYKHTTSTNDQGVRSMSVAYTLSDQISLSYGEETIEKTGKTTDIEVQGASASYTSGGMTLSLAKYKADDVDMASTGSNDNEYWKLGLAFAF